MRLLSRRCPLYAFLKKPIIFTSSAPRQLLLKCPVSPAGSNSKCIFLRSLRFALYSTSASADAPPDFGAVHRAVVEQNWNALSDYASKYLSPELVTRLLVSLKDAVPLAFKLFDLACRRRRDCAESVKLRCVFVHVLFRSRMYVEAQAALKDLILAVPVSPKSQIFHVLRDTQSSVCRKGYGVFDAFFSVLIDLEMLEEAADFFGLMTSSSLFPKIRSCNSLLHKLSRSDQGHLARKCFGCMMEVKIRPSVFTYNIMIGYFCKHGKLDDALGFFSKMREIGLIPDVVTYNSMIDGYGKLGKLEEAVLFFEKMKEAGCHPDVITYNSLIDCFCKNEHLISAFGYFSEMKKSDLKPNVVTFTTFINAFGKVGNVQQASNFFVHMKARGLSPNEVTYTSLVDGNSKAGDLEEALKLVDEMKHVGVKLNVITYTALLDAFSKRGRLEEAEQVFDIMLNAGIVPNKLILALSMGI